MRLLLFLTALVIPNTTLAEEPTFPRAFWGTYCAEKKMPCSKFATVEILAKPYYRLWYSHCDVLKVKHLYQNAYEITAHCATNRPALHPKVMTWTKQDSGHIWTNQGFKLYPIGATLQDAIAKKLAAKRLAEPARPKPSTNIMSALRPLKGKEREEARIKSIKEKLAALARRINKTKRQKPAVNRNPAVEVRLSRRTRLPIAVFGDKIGCVQQAGGDISTDRYIYVSPTHIKRHELTCYYTSKTKKARRMWHVKLDCHGEGKRYESEVAIGIRNRQLGLKPLHLHDFPRKSLDLCPPYPKAAVDARLKAQKKWAIECASNTPFFKFQMAGNTLTITNHSATKPTSWNQKVSLPRKGINDPYLITVRSREGDSVLTVRRSMQCGEATRDPTGNHLQFFYVAPAGTWSGCCSKAPIPRRR